MKKELKLLLSEKYKSHKSIRIIDGKGWNVDLYNKDTRINIKIIDSNIDCSQADSRDDDDFYEFYVYKGFSDDLRNNQFVSKEYSKPRSDYESAIEVIQKIIE